MNKLKGEYLTKHTPTGNVEVWKGGEPHFLPFIWSDFTSFENTEIKHTLKRKQNKHH